MSDPVDPQTPPPSAPPPVPPTAPPAAAPLEYAAPTTGTSDAEAKTLSMVVHILNFTCLGPIIIYLIKKGQNPYLDVEMKEALNFSITCFLTRLVISISAIIISHIIPFGGLIGVVGYGVTLAQIILGVIGGLQARDGKPYRYPVNIRFVK